MKFLFSKKKKIIIRLIEKEGRVSEMSKRLSGTREKKCHDFKEKVYENMANNLNRNNVETFRA